MQHEEEVATLADDDDDTTFNEDDVGSLFLDTSSEGELETE